MPIFPQLYGILNYEIIINHIKETMNHNNYSKFNYWIDNIGKKFNKWTILDVVVHKEAAHYLIKCECGTESRNLAYKVINGSTKSCKFCAPKYHGYYATATNRSWSAARNRCNNPNNKNYDNYGGRGITMCERWNNFENFLEDMGEKPFDMSLDRIDNNGNYEPKNCRWATRSQQMSNQQRHKKGQI